MNIEVMNMITLSEKLTNKENTERKLKYFDSKDQQQAYFFAEVLESLQDGVIILSQEGELLHANSSAYKFCCQLNQDFSQKNAVPEAIWNLCQSLIESRSVFPEKFLILSDEILVDKSIVFRVRVRWLELIKFNTPCLLVTIENRNESLKGVTLADVKKYDLTPREAEIWFLYRSKNSYKEIAAKLFISINTVKKHMKSIHSKRQHCGDNDC